MERTTPTAIAEATYEASQARRYADVRGLPNPRRAWKPIADPVILSAIIQRAFGARLEEAMPYPVRAAIAQQLDADLARRFPADDMVVLDRFGFARWIDTAWVDVDGAQGMRFALPEPRRVPNARGRFDHQFTAIGPGSLTVVQVPAQLLEAFAPVIEAHRRRSDDFTMAAAWPSRFHHEQKRRPTWAEIEAAYPAIGAWMAKQRES